MTNRSIISVTQLGRNPSLASVHSSGSDHSEKSQLSIRSFRSQRNRRTPQNGILQPSDSVSSEVFELVEKSETDISYLKQTYNKMRDCFIHFSFDTEIAERIGIDENWDISLGRMYYNRLTKSHQELLKRLVFLVKEYPSDSVYFKGLCEFLLPIGMTGVGELAQILLETLGHNYEDIFVEEMNDPIYVFEELNIRPTLFAASPRSLVTLLFFPQQPEPDYPNRLAIYLSIALKPDELCELIKRTIDGEKLTKRNISCINALLTHLLRINPSLPLQQTVGQIIEIPQVVCSERIQRFYQRQLTGNTLVTNQELLKNKKKSGEVTDVRSSVLAEQLTVFDSLLLRDVDLNECVFMKERPTVNFYCAIIDNMGSWVSHSIKTDVGNETEKMRYFIKVALECLKNHSYNMSYVIYTGVSHFSLNSIFQKLPRKALKMYDQLKTTFDISKNYIVYRNTYAIAPTPKIPILPLWLGDIIHAETSFQNSRDGGELLRMDALRTLANVLLMVNHSQRVVHKGEDLICNQLFESVSIKYEM